MKTGGKRKTGARRSASATSPEAGGNKILPKSAVEAVEAAVDQASELPAERSVGRPPGARNKRMDALRQLQETRYGVTVGELLTHTLFDGFQEHVDAGRPPGAFLEERARTMASRLGIERGKAFEHVKAMADDLMPYVHQRLPQAVEVEAKGIMLAIFTPEGGFASPTQGGGLDLRPANVRQAPAIEGEFEVKSDDGSRKDEE